MNHKSLHEASSAYDMSRFSVGEYSEEEFAHYVNQTSKLIGRSYMQTFKLMEDWPLEKIIRRYQECTKHAGDPPEGKTPEDWQAILWWSKRKQEKNQT